MAPATFTHDCLDCEPLGTYRQWERAFDLYYCPTNAGNAESKSSLGPNVLARFGNGPGMYQSGLAMARQMVKHGRTEEPLAEALRRAIAAGKVAR